MLLCYHFIVILLALFSILAWARYDGSSDPGAGSGKVAFIFAGTPRSFIHPLISKGIKKNLIESFCPKENCEPYVFARLSFSDNVHEGIRYSSVGITLPRSNSADLLIQKVKELAHNIYVEEVDIGSVKEKEEILIIGRNRTLHKIYSELDPRRYSMYYNRWSAYQMAIRVEAEKGFQFEWVVHARLDFFFGGPLQPFHLYEKIMWAVDQWSYNVPDVFALLPRRFSDIFYSLDAMYAENNVPCLGGPDFHNTFVSEKALQERGYSPELIAVVQSELCLNKFPNKARSVFDNSGVEWSLYGVSEEWLLRKLNRHGIDFAKKTLGYSTFFTVMARTMGSEISFFCLNTRPNSFIGWIRKKQRSPIAMAHACFSVEHELRILRETRKDASQSLFGANCDPYTLVTQKNPSDNPKATCLIDELVTELNFVPFRVMSEVGECLTVTNLLNKGTPPLAALQQCNETQRIRDVNTAFVVTQMFHFYPLASEPQWISNFYFLDDKRFRGCLTVTRGTTIGDYRLTMSRCIEKVDQSQLFRVVVMNDLENRNSSIPRAPVQTERVLFKWIGDDEGYCVSARVFKKGMFQKSYKIGLVPCVPANPRQRIPTMTIERIMLRGTTSYL